MTLDRAGWVARLRQLPRYPPMNGEAFDGWIRAADLDALLEALPAESTATARVHELARQMAVRHHARWAPSTKKFRESGHNGPNWLDCQHPDCVLVRVAVPTRTPPPPPPGGKER